MSLDFNFTKMTKEARADERYGWNEGSTDVAPISRAIIFSTMSVGIGTITDKNVDEFYARLIMLDKLLGIATLKMRNPAYDSEMVDNEWIDYHITPEDVRAHIGLFTNVGNERRESWVRRMFQNKGTSITDEFKADYHRGVEKADNAKQEVQG